MMLQMTPRALTPDRFAMKNEEKSIGENHPALKGTASSNVLCDVVLGVIKRSVS